MKTQTSLLSDAVVPEQNPYGLSSGGVQNKTENFLSFALTPQYQALLPTRQLAEIINLEATEIIPIPEMPAAVAGVCAWQGDVLWVVDLSYWIGSDPLLNLSSTPLNCSILKVKCQGGILGLLVYQVGQLKSCNLPDIHPVTMGLESSQAPHDNGHTLPKQPFPIRQECIRNLWINPLGEPIPILDLDMIVQHLVQ